MKRINTVLLTAWALVAALTVSAQTLTRFTSTPGSKVTIDGTSNIHDWTVEGNVIAGYFDVDKAALQKGAAGPIKAAVAVKITVRSLKSGKEKMDEVMQEHMKADQYQFIEYKLAELKIVKGSLDKGLECESTGDLTVSGVTKKVNLPVTITKVDDEKIKIVSPKVDLKMTDFGIKPPEPKLAMGLIKTGNEVKVAVEWMLKERKE
ncbi:YceI family protein [Fontisphaera persica]|uniref:YceI family protein n=1 Tax=Fontisphaera persica TaxID=2974023 RepID=UPI0024C03D37|nr:YceI family protein [Fontisphaera persica]WCJ60074.1 YceI family protein [Fontisphaera persica]